jgi:hypothetical protein
MTPVARDVLLQPFRGDRPGVTFYSLQARDAWPGLAFPAEYFEGVIECREHIMNGEFWEIVLWDITFSEFPSNEAWRGAVDRAFSWIISQKGVASWVGDGIGFAAPPDLFDPVEMSNAVLEAVVQNGLRLGLLNLDMPVKYLNGEELLSLRNACEDLATSE